MPRWRQALVALAIALLVPVGIASTGGPGAFRLGAALAMPLEVLAARSPGARPKGALTQSKPIKAQEMQERLLYGLRERPKAPGDAPGPVVPVANVVDVTPEDGVAPGAPAVLVAPDDGVVVPGDAPVDIAGPGPGSLIPGVVVTPGVSIPTTGGGGGGGGGGTGTTPTPPITVTPETPAPAIPEPATWLTLMAGFAAIGGALRDRRTVAGPSKAFSRRI